MDGVSVVEVTTEMALWLLECVKGAEQEGYAPRVGDRKADPTGAEVDRVLAALASIAGVEVEDVMER